MTVQSTARVSNHSFLDFGSVSQRPRVRVQAALQITSRTRTKDASCSRPSIDVMAFMFCERPQREETCVDEAEETDYYTQSTVKACSLRHDLVDIFRLSPLDRTVALQAAASFLPAAMAAHSGLLVDNGVAVACLPVIVPFSVPQVSADAWLASKRARAFHRCCIIAVYLQGGMAFLKFIRGDLVGGVYDAIQAVMGAYAVQPFGIRFFPSYMMISGFNGLLGLFQVFQQGQGIPIQLLPKMAYLPAAVSLWAAYCGWQFCSEVRAIGMGYQGDGAQDSCFVKVMGGDWWPQSLPLSPEASMQEGPSGGFAQYGQHTSGNGGFSAFGGSGRRLGPGEQ